MLNLSGFVLNFVLEGGDRGLEFWNFEDIEVFILGDFIGEVLIDFFFLIFRFDEELDLWIDDFEFDLLLESVDLLL